MYEFTSPCLVVLTGAPLAGKTTLAELVAQQSNLTHLDVDSVRFELDPESERLTVTGPLERWLMISAYETMIARARLVLYHGKAVILSGTFSRQVFKRPLLGLLQDAAAIQLPAYVFELNTSGEEVRRRIEVKNSSGLPAVIKTWEQYQWALTIREPWGPSILPVRVESGIAPREALDQFLPKLIELVGLVGR